jgi:tRNA dimethylallyltransferase
MIKDVPPAKNCERLHDTVPKSSLPPLLITGPTAAGKSAYALARATEHPSVIVNADSMQVYADLAILSARPGATESAALPHLLYGHVDGAQAYSSGRYYRDVAAILDDPEWTGCRLVIVGGTGLYFRALTQGLSPVPEIEPGVRAHWREHAGRLAPHELHAILAVRDPEMAARLRPSDPQRVTRALEVLESTGQSLAQWQRTPGVPLIDEALCERVVIMPDRAALYVRADARFEAMMAAGALDEVKRLTARDLDPALPVMRALGVPPLMQHLRGELTLEAAVAAAKLETRQYIKRQLTWIKSNMNAWNMKFAQ